MQLNRTMTKIAVKISIYSMIRVYLEKIFNFCNNNNKPEYFLFNLDPEYITNNY